MKRLFILGLLCLTTAVHAGTNYINGLTADGIITGTNTSNLFGAQHLQFVNTNLVTGSGTVSAVINGHLWTNSGTGFANLQIGNLFLRGTFQVSVCEVLSSSVIRTVEPADQTYSGATWTYYSNYTDIYDSVPRWVGGILSDGGYWVRSGDFVNSGKQWMGGGRTVGAWDIATNYGNFGPFMRFLVLGTDDTFKVPVFLGLNSPNNSFAVMNDGYVMIGTGISNIAGTAIPFKVQPQFTTGSPTAGKVLTSTDSSGSAVWSNANAGTVTSVALAAAPAFTVTGSPVTSSGTLTFADAAWVNMASSNADFSTGAYQMKETGSALAIQLTNEPAKGWAMVKIRNTTTANAFTVTASTGRTNFWEGGVSNPTPMDNAFVIYTIVFGTNENHIYPSYDK